MGQIPLELDQLHTHKLISHLDYYFARSVADVHGVSHEWSRISLALASMGLAQGDICLDLDRMAGSRLAAPDSPEIFATLPEKSQWLSHLQADAMVSGGDAHGAGQGITPLVLDDNGHLFLARYHDFQMRLVANLSQRFQRRSLCPDAEFTTAQVNAAFDGQNPDHVRFQKDAVEKALAHDFVIISGGPGTGKTHITNVMKKILRQWGRDQGLSELRILSLAPTGKAASRLKDGRTIHSALGPKWDGPGFVHGTDYPLAVDLVIVDEASMIDLALMTRLLEAIPVTAKVILLGDAHQLSPVQAGTVFCELCRLPGLEFCTAFLAHNFRSHGREGIAALARAVKQGEARQAEEILTGNAYPDLEFVDTSQTPADTAMQRLIYEGYKDFMESPDVETALGRMDGFRILCAHNDGPEGRLPINHLCESILHSRGDFDINVSILSRMIIIGSNDYKRGVFNGDTGVVYREGGMLKAAFPGESSEDRKVFRHVDLPAHDTAYAMTIHKSQGSEFDTVLIRLPETPSRALTRELLYTGITRAKDRVIVVGRPEVVREAVSLSQELTGTVGAALEERLRCHETID